MQPNGNWSDRNREQSNSYLCVFDNYNMFGIIGIISF